MAVYLTTSHVPGAVSQLGGGYAWLRQCDATGAAVSPADIFASLPFIKESDLEDTTAKKEYELENGDVLYADGARKVAFTFTFLQRDVPTLTLAVGAMRGKFFNLLKQVSDQTVNGVYQYLYAPIVQAEASVKYKTQGNEVQIKLFCTRAAASVTNSTWSGVSGAASTTFPTGASITVDPAVTNATNQTGYYTWYTVTS